MSTDRQPGAGDTSSGGASATASPVTASAPGGAQRLQRATAILFALAGGLVMVFGLLFMFASQQAGAAAGDVTLISMRGERVEIRDHLATGKFTIVDFYADWCANCKLVTPYLEELARVRGDVAVRKINIVTWETPVVAQYRVTYLPYLQMYGPDGQLMAEGADAVLTELKNRFAPAQAQSVGASS
jgi:thiol-disulfide isomerase/thioredoxin